MIRLLVAALVCALALDAGAAFAKTMRGPSVATAQSATKTVVITAKTRVVNVNEYDVVLFKVGAKQFALDFDGAGATYDLAKLAPAGVLARKITVVVSPKPGGHEQGIP